MGEVRGIKTRQEELAGQKAELGWLVVGEHQQDLTEVDNADDPEDKEATKAPPTRDW